MDPCIRPKVVSAKDVEIQKPDFQMYHTVPMAEAPVPAMDPEVAKFLPLLQEYLKIHDIMPPSIPSTACNAAQGGQPIAVPVPPLSKDDLDYV
ncbi:hypothetical protein EWM64_g4696 [Hericium alpestre]|uniref:Uncharacterized protein n=1 Tax=Hericium alpestre TaxID=135208 RepID=A0A4Y9ZWQ3_9AGAM|nr:hypothetical protein EWM64_g4696 [Hericium alpestre]